MKKCIQIKEIERIRNRISDMLKAVASATAFIVVIIDNIKKQLIYLK